MRNNRETTHDDYADGHALLDELSNCQIWCIGHDEESEKDEFTLSGFGTHDDPLYVTRKELKSIGLALVEIAESHCEHCESFDG